MHMQELRALNDSRIRCHQVMLISLTGLVGLPSGPAKVCVLNNHLLVFGGDLCAAHLAKLLVVTFRFADN